MQLLGFHVPPVAVAIFVALLAFCVRRMARRAGKATGAALATRRAAADSLPPSTAQTAANTASGAFAAFDAPLTDGPVASQTKGELGVAEVTAVSNWSGSTAPIELELDAIGAPKRRVSADLPAGLTLERGDRVYVMVDPDNDRTVTILPPSMTGGQTLPKEGNRLDALVLGPQILRVGTKATGVVKAVESRPLANAALGEHGMSKWYLEFEVQPEQGWPYRAELTITLSTPEKVERIAHVGAKVPLRYDPEDTRTIAIDSIEMGYGDPYASLANLAGMMGGNASVTASASVSVMAAKIADGVARSVAESMASIGGDYKVVMIDGGQKKVNAIKILRDVRPDLSLNAAKNIVESRWETNVVEGLSQAQAQAICTKFEQAGARVELRQA
jgi:ribosomal protein L7/L12